MTNVGTRILILVLLLLTIGCAKTVTTKPTFGTEMLVTVNLRGNADTVNNRYFMVLSTNEAFTVPLPPPNNMDYEFLSVGDLPQSGSQETYYTNYYSTWSGYIEMNNNGYYLTKGPFTYGTASTAEILSDQKSSTSTISFSFRLEQIFGTAIPNTIYFDIITVEYPLSGFKRTKDLLYPPNRSIQKYSGADTSISDSSDASLDADLDITGCRVIIQ